MARSVRVDVGDEVYHILNRANARLPIFFDENDYKLFENILQDGKEKYGMRIIAYCLMPNHFHLVLYPKKEGDLGKFMQWVTLTHTQRWHIKNKTIGSGHLYQGRYKSFLIEKDKHLLTAIRYIERNPLRADLVQRAEDWNYSSLSKRLSNRNNFLDRWPIEEPQDYLSFVNMPIYKHEQEALRLSIQKGKPYGSNTWSNHAIQRHNLIATTRNRGRPRNGT